MSNTTQQQRIENRNNRPLNNILRPREFAEHVADRNTLAEARAKGKAIDNARLLAAPLASLSAREKMDRAKLEHTAAVIAANTAKHNA